MKYKCLAWAKLFKELDEYRVWDDNVLSQRKEVLNLRWLQSIFICSCRGKLATFVDLNAEMKKLPNNCNNKNEIPSQRFLALGNLLVRSPNPEKLWRFWWSGIRIVRFKTSNMLLGNAYLKITGFFKLERLQVSKPNLPICSRNFEEDTIATINVSATWLRWVLWCVHHPFLLVSRIFFHLTQYTERISWEIFFLTFIKIEPKGFKHITYQRITLYLASCVPQLSVLEQFLEIGLGIIFSVLWW